MLLRRFCDDNGALWVYNKRAPHLGIITVKPCNDFYRKHFYRSENNGIMDNSLEIYFAKLEGAADNVIEKICASARAGIRLSLTVDEKRTWDMFLYFQWKRTPDLIISYISDIEFENLLEDYIAKFERDVRPLIDSERERTLSKDGKKRLRKNAHVGAIADPAAEVQNILNNMGIGIAVIHNPNAGFVIGSRSVIKLTPPGETRLGHPGVEAWLPVAADVAVCAIPGKGQELVITLDDDRWLRSFNNSIVEASTLVAGRSESLIRSLVVAR